MAAGITQAAQQPKDLSGLKAVVVGGGTGAPRSIRALLSLGAETSCVVAMADDGGSTGYLRSDADATPPGDVRKCLVAFARNPEDPLVQAFRYRFDFEHKHALGNLVLLALEDTAGSFDQAVRLCERLLDCQGHVHPSTLDHVTLCARTREGVELSGQAEACHDAGVLETVWFQQPEQVRAYEPALQALREADLIVLGPGSLFTSVIPNLLVPGVVDAIRHSNAQVVYCCSVSDAQGETRGLGVTDYISALERHGLRSRIDAVLVHDPRSEHDLDGVETDDDDDARVVRFDGFDAGALQAAGIRAVVDDFADDEHPDWHSIEALAKAFGEVARVVHR